MPPARTTKCRSSRRRFTSGLSFVSAPGGFGIWSQRTTDTYPLCAGRVTSNLTVGLRVVVLSSSLSLPTRCSASLHHSAIIWPPLQHERFSRSDKSGVDSWTTLQKERSFQMSQAPLAIRLRAQSEWLDLFGEYRNLVIHNAPLAVADATALVTYTTLGTHLGPLPTVVLPLPADPKSLRTILSCGESSNVI